MTPEEIARMKAVLNALRLGIVDSGNEGIKPNRGEGDMGDDGDTQPLNEMNQVIASSRNVKRSGELALIVAALTKLNFDPEDYGYCEECDEPIPKGRLKLMPWAKYCVKCQSAFENPLGGRRKHLRDFN